MGFMGPLVPRYGSGEKHVVIADFWNSLTAQRSFFRLAVS
jgi:hypothetical protein